MRFGFVTNRARTCHLRMHRVYDFTNKKRIRQVILKKQESLPLHTQHRKAYLQAQT